MCIDYNGVIVHDCCNAHIFIVMFGSQWPVHVSCLITIEAYNYALFQMWNRFDKFNSLHKNFKYNLPESEIFDLTEAACDRSEYDR